LSLLHKTRIRSQRGFSGIRIAMVLVALMATIELSVAGAGGLFSGTNAFKDIAPTTSPFTDLHVGFASIGPAKQRPAIERLMAAAEKLATRTNVPYVFGGHQIGKAKSCQDCTECIRKNHLAANSTMMRYNSCSACRSCGIDCSSFVNRLFAEAGMKYRFADTRTLNHMKDGFLQEQFGFINMGDDLSVARPGDLLLEKGHVVMVLDIDMTLGTIDYIHASRGSKRTRVGGIELRRGASLARMQKDVVRILRHRELVVPEDSDILLTSAKALWSDMRRLLAVNR
jgi:cell wall-associated NlpC family hydrolase